MVKVKEKFERNEDGSLNKAAWLKKIQEKYQLSDISLIKQACELTDSLGKGLTTFYGQPCIEQGMEIAEIILDLQLDPITVVAAILIGTTQYSHASTEQISKHLGDKIAKLVDGVLQMNTITLSTSASENRNEVQIDRLRKIILAMASDIRVVIIKLAERMVIMRGIKNINVEERKRLARETMDIYAPLANRLGIGQIKWELEDLAFHYLNPETYKSIASFLSEKRVDREKTIKQIINQLKKSLQDAHISTAEVTGRVKHIYSIYRKSQNKQRDYKDIFDFSAARILVPTIQDCYTALSTVHNLWEQISEEFDDYITHPKPNGYQSIHTAVIGPNKKNIEIQIRTYEMHEQSEHGIAAHWLYKENHKKTGYEDKITYLRQLLAWQQDITKEEHRKKAGEIFSDRVYVFSPAGDIIDMPVGATPLDFAYHIHSQLGHRCRGAKVNGQIVSLNHPLETGDKVEVLTIQQGSPSRDWLNNELGYLKTSRARSKVAQWFRHQEINQYVEMGKQLLERELSKLRLNHVNLHKLSSQLGFKTEEAFLTSVGHGSIRTTQILNAIQSEHKEKQSIHLPIKKITSPTAGLSVEGSGDFLTRLSKCCKPIPGDSIIGFITQGRGISIHRIDCYNVSHLSPKNENRLINVSWDDKHTGKYSVDVYVLAHGGEEILKSITTILTNINITLVALKSTINQKAGTIHIMMTVQINDSSQLKVLINQIHQLPSVIDAKRITD